MNDFLRQNKHFEASEKRAQAHSKTIQSKIEKSRQLSNELNSLVDQLAKICTERGLKV